MKQLRLLHACVLAIGIAAPAGAQTVDDVRDQLRGSLRSSQFASAFAGLMIFSDELELSGANYKVNNDDGNLSDTELETIAVPFQKRFAPWGEAPTKIYLEGVLGYGNSSRSAKDIYSGTVPGLETSVDTDWLTAGGLLGLGLEFKVIDGLTVAPIADAGVSYIRSDADYGGPGAGVSAAILDGLAFNWDGWTATGGGALRIDWVRPVGKGYGLEMVGRYDYRWSQTFDTTSSAQEFSSQFQLLTLRSDLVGPTGLAPFGRTLYWRMLAGYRHFLEGSIYDIHDMVLLGAGLEYDITNVLPMVTRLTLQGGLILGDDLTGYTIGLGVSF